MNGDRYFFFFSKSVRFLFLALYWTNRHQSAQFASNKLQDATRLQMLDPCSKSFRLQGRESAKFPSGIGRLAAFTMPLCSFDDELTKDPAPAGGAAKKQPR